MSKRKHKTCCVVKNCNSKSGENVDLKFHYFPKKGKYFIKTPNYFGVMEKLDILEAWKKALQVKEISNHAVVCSLHFLKTDYIPTYNGVSRKLKRIAVPSCNLPSKVSEEKLNKRRLRAERLKQRNLQKEFIKTDTNNKKIKLNNATLESCIKEIDNVIAEKTKSTNDDDPKDCNELHKADIGIQVYSIEDPKFINFIKTDAQLKTTTGIESFAILNCIVDLVTLISKPDETGHDDIPKMNLRDKIILTYVKLKQNLPYSFLTVMFNCSSVKHCSRVFRKTLNLLSICLNVAVPWPTRQEISKNIPACFLDFKDVRVVLNCIEIYIQHSKKLCCQLITYSHYRQSDTCKIMTGVTPAGNISFISNVYGGRMSDKAIFKQSGLINLLEQGDAVMVDSCFLIDEICDANKIKCIKSPVLQEKNQFSKCEADLAVSIAKARVHVDRSNQRIKMFKIISGLMPINLVPDLKEIFTVICGTINLSSPLIADDEFIIVNK